jgi:hypothetical protein
VRDVLSNSYHDGWIGTGGPIAWPARSPDLNPLDFYLWGHLNTLAYAAPVDNEETLHHRTVDACQTINNYPGNFEWMLRSMMSLVKACIEFHGGDVEHFYKCTLSVTAHKSNVSGHMLIWIVFLVLVRETRFQNLSAPFSYTVHMNHKVCALNQ